MEGTNSTAERARLIAGSKSEELPTVNSPQCRKPANATLAAASKDASAKSVKSHGIDTNWCKIGLVIGNFLCAGDSLYTLFMPRKACWMRGELHCPLSRPASMCKERKLERYFLIV